MKKFKIVLKMLLVFLLIAFIAYQMAVKLREDTIKNHEVRGVDVSAYQAEIDWKILEAEGVDFAFIKATEGSSFKDRYFEKNIKNIADTGIVPGAYHFLSFESEGTAQAENFISSVDKDSIALPPVIDIELYGEFKTKPASAEKVGKIMDDMIDALYEEYGRYPIIYTTRRAYLLYISGKYKNCDIWISDVLSTPSLPDGREWTFWQYSHTETLSGYNGEEEHIDMNVFCGTREEFEDYLRGER